MHVKLSKANGKDNYIKNNWKEYKSPVFFKLYFIFPLTKVLLILIGLKFIMILQRTRKYKVEPKSKLQKEP